jgi:hypothetical protein
MLLENIDIDPSELPQIEEATWHQLDQDYLYMRLTSRGMFFLFIAGIASLISIFGSLIWWHWLGPWLFLITSIFTVEILGFKIKAYAIRSNDISFRTGLLFFSTTSIPLNRIQHCEYTQGPLGRLFDLASVKIYTAGGAASDMIISGLHKERAVRLRDYIIKLSAAHE